MHVYLTKYKIDPFYFVECHLGKVPMLFDIRALRMVLAFMYGKSNKQL